MVTASDDTAGPGLLRRAGDLHRLDGQAGTYLLRVPAVLDRPVFRRELRRAGARQVSDLDLLDGLAAGLAAIAAQTGEAVPADQLEAVQAHREQVAEAYEQLRQSRFDTSIDVAAVVRQLQPPPLVRMVEAVVTRHWPGYTDLVADRDSYGEFAGIVGAQLFLRGWESATLPAFVRRHDGGPDESCLRAVPLVDLLAIGATVQQLLQPEHQTLGNLPAASGSAPGPTPSPTTGTQPAKARSRGTTRGTSRRSGSRA